MPNFKENIYLTYLDLANRPIVRGKLSGRVKDLALWCGEFYKEIEWWFSIREKTQYPQSLYLRKPICIELYEFANYLCLMYDTINRIVHLVNEKYVEAGLDRPLPFVNLRVKKIANKWLQQLKNPRNIVAAHRYTKKRGKFLTLNDVIKALNLLGWEKLNQAWLDLSKVQNELEAWLSNPINKNHLILADRLSKYEKHDR